MTDFNALGLVVALLLVNAFVFISMDKWVQDRSDAIASGVIRGVPVSIKHRRYLLQTRFLIHGPTLITIEGLLVAAWGTLLFPFWYLHLASLLRQAQGD